MNDPDPARTRFIVLQALRLSGAALAGFGAAVVAGKAPLPAEAGYLLLIVGAADALVAPALLARRWRTRQP